jgi:signal transduction histidine kinase
MSRLSSMKTKVVGFVTISTVALLGLALNSFLTLNSVKVGGDAYDEVLASERLIADVLPPPAYIIESYLTVQQLVNNTDPALEPVLRQRLEGLEADYSERQDFYIETVTDPDMAQALKLDSQEPARQFFQLVQDELLPALDAGDLDTARSLANNDLRDAYEMHRAAIDQVVVLAMEDSLAAETSANDLVSSRTNLLLVTVIVAFLVTALVGAIVAAAIVKPVRRVVHTATVTLPALVQRIRDTGDATITDEELAVDSNDELGEATRAFNSVIVETVEMAKAQADLRRTAQENFVNLGRRSQNLLSRQIQLIEKAEEGEDDPEVLDTLFKIDHLAARMRRNAESLLVLADRQPPRKRRGAVALDAVLRAAASEIEQYQRVRVADGEPIDLDGQYAPELVHLFAELLENAVRFSSPDTDVKVNAMVTDDGCTVAISDQGIGLSPDELAEANRRLTGTVKLNEANYLGHFVVGRLASRLEASVHLETRETGGLTAVVHLPSDLLTEDDHDDLRDRPALTRMKAAQATAEAQPEPASAETGAPDKSEAPAPAAIPTPSPEMELADGEGSGVEAAAGRPLVEAMAGAGSPARDTVGAAARDNGARNNGTRRNGARDNGAGETAARPIPQPSGSLTAESFGLRKRESGSSLSKTQRAGHRADGADGGTSRNAESVRDRFSSFAAGRQQAQTPSITESVPDEESN